MSDTEERSVLQPSGRPSSDAAASLLMSVKLEAARWEAARCCVALNRSGPAAAAPAGSNCDKQTLSSCPGQLILCVSEESYFLSLIKMMLPDEKIAAAAAVT